MVAFPDRRPHPKTMTDSALTLAQTRLLLLFNEWFLDTDAGVPHLQKVMIKPSNLPLAEALIKRTILQTEGVAELRSFGMTFDRETRRLTIQATVANTYGTVANIKVSR